MGNLIYQLNKEIAIERIKNEKLLQQIEDQSLLESWQTSYLDIFINLDDEEEIISSLQECYYDSLQEFNRLKNECLKLANSSNNAIDYYNKIMGICIPTEFVANSIDEAMETLSVDLHNAMLMLFEIRRDLIEESKIKSIESLLG